MANKSMNKAKKTSATRRGTGAFLMLLLAVFSLLSVAGTHALFLDLLYDALIHLFGMAAPVFPVSCLAACLVLFFHRDRPIAFRVCCALFLTAAAAVLCQLLVSDKTYVWDVDLFSRLWEDAAQRLNGGLLGGLLGKVFVSIFSQIGAVLLWVLLTAGAVFSLFRLTLYHVLEMLSSSDRRKAERRPRSPNRAGETTSAGREPPGGHRSMPPSKEKGARPSRHSYDLPVGGKMRSAVDIPLDGEAAVVSINDGLAGSGFLADGDFTDGTAPPTRPDHTNSIPADSALADDNPVTRDSEAGFHVSDNSAIESGNPLFKKRFRGARPATQLLDSDDCCPETDKKKKSPKRTALLESSDVHPAPPSFSEGEGLTLQPHTLSGRGGSYVFPPLSLLSTARAAVQPDRTDEVKANTVRLLETIRSFGIEARIVSVTRGPSVTRFELELERGVKLSRLTGLSDDIALSLGASGVRIAPIPDKMSVVGIEVPNRRVSIVYLRDVLSSDTFHSKASKLSIAIGKDIGNNAVVGDLAKYTHLLIAGTTGSGKSVCMNSLIVSLLYKATPDEVKMIMIDPKMVELGIYNGIPHLEVPVVTDPKKAAGALQWAVVEMERRYRRFMEHRVRDIFSYNRLIHGVSGEEPMPQMVIIIDELADLMLVAAKEVEESICRLAQKARAAGMHLVIATQRPSADVITGLMKANIPSRIAFAVASHLESRIILDTGGAEKLVGRGDMLLFPLGTPKPTRVQGCLISGTEVEQIVETIKRDSEPQYSQECMEEVEKNAENIGKKGTSGGAATDGYDDSDPMLDAAIDVVMETGQASTSFLQRRLKLGFARAARIVDQMEDRGIVGPSEGAKPRAILISRQQWAEIKMRKEDDAPF